MNLEQSGLACCFRESYANERVSYLFTTRRNHLKRIAALIIVIALITSPLFGSIWEFDKAHSHIGFVVSHMVITKVNGQFNDFSGTIDFDGKDFSKASVEVTIDPHSIDTQNERRNAHLKSPDFFAADSFPQMGFKSKKVIPGADGDFKVIGDLTMRGVTKEVTLDAHLNGTIVDPGGSTRAGFTATTKINRQDWGISWSKKLDTGGLVAGDEVTINLDIEAVAKKN